MPDMDLAYHARAARSLICDPQAFMNLDDEARDAAWWVARAEFAERRSAGQTGRRAA